MTVNVIYIYIKCVYIYTYICECVFAFIIFCFVDWSRSLFHWSPLAAGLRQLLWLWIATFFGPLIWSSWSFAVPVGIFHQQRAQKALFPSKSLALPLPCSGGTYNLRISGAFPKCCFKKPHFYIGCITWSCWCHLLLWRKDSSASVASCWHAPRAMGWKTPGHAQKNPWFLLIVRTDPAVHNVAEVRWLEIPADYVQTGVATRDTKMLGVAKGGHLTTNVDNVDVEFFRSILVVDSFRQKQGCKPRGKEMLFGSKIGDHWDHRKSRKSSSSPTDAHVAIEVAIHVAIPCWPLLCSVASPVFRIEPPSLSLSACDICHGMLRYFP